MGGLFRTDGLSESPGIEGCAIHGKAEIQGRSLRAGPKQVHWVHGILKLTMAILDTSDFSLEDCIQS